MDQKPLPKPPVVVGGYGSPSVSLNRTVRGSINYQYPPDFPEESRALVKLEEIRAGRDFNDKSKGVSERELRAMLLVCAMRPALAFTHEMIRLDWGADRIDSHMRDFVGDTLRWAGLPTDTEFETSAEWRRYQDELLEASAIQGGRSASLENAALQHPQDSTKESGDASPNATLRQAFVSPRLEALGMTPSKWASTAGVHPSIVYDFLAGRSNPRPDTRNLLAEALGVKASDLPR
jgi:hypothetical protein